MPPVDPTELLVENAFDLVGLSNGLSLEVRQVLQELFEEIVGELKRIDPTDASTDAAARQRVDVLLAKVEGIAGEAGAEVHELVRARVAAIGAQQSRFAADLLKHSLGSLSTRIEKGTLTLRYAKKILDTDPIQGELLSKAFEGMSERVVSGFRRELQLGMTRQETLADIVRRIRGRSDGSGGFGGGVMETTTRGANALVRTAVNDISNQALMDVWEENEDIVDGYTVLATLDEKTCLICGPLDGEEFETGDPKGQPPFHMGCRCVTTPRIAWKRLGVPPPKDGERASEDGPVPASTDWTAWMKSADRETQDRILGPSRADLFRSGDISLRELVRSDGRVVTLDELAQR